MPIVLGVWNDIQSRRAAPFTHMTVNLSLSLIIKSSLSLSLLYVCQWVQVWDGIGNTTIEFDCAETGRDALGWIVENSISLLFVPSCDFEIDFQLFFLSLSLL
jgi:hypothetical protein